jgi:hypothetical protein
LQEGGAGGLVVVFLLVDPGQAFQGGVGGVAVAVVECLLVGGLQAGDVVLVAEQDGEVDQGVGVAGVDGPLEGGAGAAGIAVLAEDLAQDGQGIAGLGVAGG